MACVLREVPPMSRASLDFPAPPLSERRLPEEGGVQRPHRLKYALSLVALATVYLIAGKLGLKLALVNRSASAVWPPTGIALAALLLLGYRVWPAIFVGAFLVNVTTAGTVLTSLGIATGNTLEAVAACYLVSRFTHGCKAFDRAHDIFRFALLATVV